MNLDNFTSVLNLNGSAFNISLISMLLGEFLSEAGVEISCM